MEDFQTPSYIVIPGCPNNVLNNPHIVKFRGAGEQTITLTPSNCSNGCYPFPITGIQVFIY
jgi:hypothetical protein